MVANPAPVLIPTQKKLREVSAAQDGHRLRKHADYQRVYREGRKQFASSLSYFFALRGDASAAPAGPRVGLTAGKVLGNAVARNRIKRRMRDIVRRRIGMVNADVDIVLHPKRCVVSMDFAKLEDEVVRIFGDIKTALATQQRRKTSLRATAAELQGQS